MQENIDKKHITDNETTFFTLFLLPLQIDNNI